MEYDDDWEDPAHVLKVTRLYPEEEPAVAISLQLTRDELQEAPRRTKMPPLSDDEQPNPCSVVAISKSPKVLVVWVMVSLSIEQRYFADQFLFFIWSGGEIQVHILYLY